MLPRLAGEEIDRFLEGEVVEVNLGDDDVVEFMLEPKDVGGMVLSRWFAGVKEVAIDGPDFQRMEIGEDDVDHREIAGGVSDVEGAGIGIEADPGARGEGDHLCAEGLVGSDDVVD